MNGNAGARAQDTMRFESVFGVHVHGRHEPARLVRSNRQEGDARRSEALADPREVRAEGGVGREIRHPEIGLDHITRPERAVAVGQSAAGEVEGRTGVDGGAAYRQGIAPVQLMHRPDALRFQELAQAERRHELRGRSFKDKILVFPGAKGSSGWSHYFHLTRVFGVAPKALIFSRMTTKVALGAVVTRAPAVTDLDQDALAVIETGDWVKVDADRGVVEVVKRQHKAD